MFAAWCDYGLAHKISVSITVTGAKMRYLELFESVHIDKYSYASGPPLVASWYGWKLQCYWGILYHRNTHERIRITSPSLQLSLILRWRIMPIIPRTWERLWHVTQCTLRNDGARIYHISRRLWYRGHCRSLFRRGRMLHGYGGDAAWNSFCGYRSHLCAHEQLHFAMLWVGERSIIRYYWWMTLSICARPHWIKNKQDKGIN